MTYSIQWEPAATNGAAGFLLDDPSGLRALFDRLDTLATDPRPDDAFPFGSPDRRRVRVGRYRALFEISDDDQVIHIIHIGRTD
jgi:mRNA interferase RelE/StbE